MPFTGEEVCNAMYENLALEDRAESVHLLLFPRYQEERVTEPLMLEWEKIRHLRESILKALEEVRQKGVIGNSLEAKVHIRCSGEIGALLRRHENDLRFIFIVSQVVVEEATDAKDGFQVDVFKADGNKCERCWNFSVSVGSDAEHPTLCERCVPAVREM